MKRHNTEHRLSGAILKLAASGLAMLAVIACNNSTAAPGPTAPLNLPAETAPRVTAAQNPTSPAGPTLLPEARSLPSGDPDLYRAIWAGTADEVRSLVAEGMEVNASNEDGDPFLYTAIWRAQPDTVQILVDAGADVDARNSRTPCCTQR